MVGLAVQNVFHKSMEALTGPYGVQLVETLGLSEVQSLLDEASRVDLSGTTLIFGYHPVMGDVILVNTMGDRHAIIQQ